MFLIGRSFVRKDPRMIAAIMLGAILFSCVRRFEKIFNQFYRPSFNELSDG
jgi:hypothetical protein